jgi:lipopolysaccharide export system permease protein
MRLHDRYILGLFLKALFFCIVSLVVIFFLVDLFEKIDDFIDHSARVRDVARFYGYKLPEMARLTLPVAVMLASILTLGILGRQNEIVAFLASGVSMLRLTAPVLVVATGIVGVHALLSELVVPRTNGRMLRVLHTDIEKHDAADASVRHSFVYRGEGDVLYYARTFNTRTQTLREVTVDRYARGRIVAHIHASTGVWRDGTWEFENGSYRVFAPDSTGQVVESVQHFTKRRFPELRETPEDLARLHPETDAMNYVQLRRHVAKLRDGGAEVNDYLVDLDTKISYPLTNLIMAVLGVGLSATKRKTGLLTGVGLTLSIAFAYLAFAQFTEALGKNENIPPLLAAWLGPLVFGVASIGLFARVNR